ncbi:hypothetical protein ACTSKR_07555 [Chitinibacteraceae bacterium HSL-7]
MKLTVALFLCAKYNYSSVEIARPDGTFHADSDPDYARLSQTAEIELPDLSAEEVITHQLAALNQKEAALRAGFERQLTQLQARRAELMALPAPATSGAAA